MEHLLRLMKMAFILLVTTVCVQSTSSTDDTDDEDFATIYRDMQWEVYKKYCSFWILYPPQIISLPIIRKSIIQIFKNTVVNVGSIPECVELILLAEYPIPSRAELKDLRNSKLPIVWVLGGPGSGKGTMCSKFKAAEGYTHISVGELLRDQAKKASDPTVRKVLEDTMKEGQLVPDYFTVNLLTRKMMDEFKNSKGFLIDGFPRAVNQGILFQKTIKAPDVIISLEVNEEILRQRILNRKEGRADDNEDTFKRRMAVYLTQTKLVTEADIFKYKVRIVRAERSVEENYALFSNTIKGFLAFHRGVSRKSK